MAMNLAARFLKGNLLGVRFAINAFIGTTALWLLVTYLTDSNPIWSILSMITAIEPVVKDAVRMFQTRLINAVVGCAVGFSVLIAGGSTAWKLPIAISLAVLVSTYVVRVETMWRQAAATAAIVIASGLSFHSTLGGVEHGLRNLAQIIVGCLVGLIVSWVMVHLWPVPESSDGQSAECPG
jgi:uncharacterized membrane protein YccC